MWTWTKAAVLALIAFIIIVLLAAYLVLRSLRPTKADDGTTERGGNEGAAVSLQWAGRRVATGERVDLSTASVAPSVRLDGADRNALYTIVMYDPDAPSRRSPTAAPWRHWVAINAKADATGTLLAGPGGNPYAGPDPPAGSGPHKYVVAVYRQEGPLPRDISFDGPRAKWDKEGFVRDNALHFVARTSFEAERP